MAVEMLGSALLCTHHLFVPDDPDPGRETLDQRDQVREDAPERLYRGLVERAARSRKCG